MLSHSYEWLFILFKREYIFYIEINLKVYKRLCERRMRVIKLKQFTRTDFKQLINWIDSEEFLIQWSGSAFTYPLNEQQLEKYIESANTLAFKVIDEETKSSYWSYFTWANR